MFAFEITESAESDLDRIVDYLSGILCNPQAADTLLAEIEQATAASSINPEAFPLCADSRLADLGCRKVPVRAYIMIYEVDEPNNVVRVLRFFHESENYSGKM